jgi:hypothetical protein
MQRSLTRVGLVGVSLVLLCGIACVTQADEQRPPSSSADPAAAPTNGSPEPFLSIVETPPHTLDGHSKPATGPSVAVQLEVTARRTRTLDVFPPDAGVVDRFEVHFAQEAEPVPIDVTLPLETVNRIRAAVTSAQAEAKLTTPGPHATAVYIKPLRDSDFYVRVRSDDPEGVQIGGYRCDINEFLKILHALDQDYASLSGRNSAAAPATKPTPRRATR